MSELKLPKGTDVGEVSDGYHTFNELYENRHMLFIALMSLNLNSSVWSHNNSDGSSMDGWFLAVLDLPGIGHIRYHMPDRLIPLVVDAGVNFSAEPPQWDGKGNSEMLGRLENFICSKLPTPAVK